MQELTFIIGQFGYGGAGVHTKALISAMIKRSDISKIHIISNDNPFDESEKISFYPIGYNLGSFVFNVPIRFFLTAFIVHKNKLQNTTIIAINRVFGTYENLYGIFHGLGKLFAQDMRIKGYGWKSNFFAFFKYVYSIFDKSMISKSKKTIFVSERSRTKVIELYPKYKDHIIHVPNFYNKSLFYVDQEGLKSNRDHISLGYVGRIERLKGIAALCESIQENYDEFMDAIGNFKLYVAGSGDLVEYVSSFSFVEYVGRIPHNELREFYSKLDLFVFPSKSENFPTVILEAMACGIKIVSNNVGDVKYMLDGEVIMDQVVFEGKDFLTRIVQILTSKKYNDLGKLNLGAVEKYSSDVVVSNYLKALSI